MSKFYLFATILFLFGCSEDDQMNLSQFEAVNSDMKELSLSFLDRTLPIYCGNKDTEAGKGYLRSKKYFIEPELRNKLEGKTTLDKGVYLYSVIDNKIIAIASVPHNNYPIDDLHLIIRGFVQSNGKEVYFQTGIGINEYSDFADLIEKNIIQEKCLTS